MKPPIKCNDCPNPNCWAATITALTFFTVAALIGFMLVRMVFC